GGTSSILASLVTGVEELSPACRPLLTRPTHVAAAPRKRAKISATFVGFEGNTPTTCCQETATPLSSPHHYVICVLPGNCHTADRPYSTRSRLLNILSQITNGWELTAHSRHHTPSELTSAAWPTSIHCQRTLVTVATLLAGSIFVKGKGKDKKREGVVVGGDGQRGWWSKM
ncbi:hypothetical protein S83_067308, partial [Arachis hypogaea]